jgi:hypothetical protein
MALTRLATNGFHLYGSDFSQDKTTLESENRWTLVAFNTHLANLDSNNAAHNSNLGKVVVFSGATIDLKVIRFTLICNSSNINASALSFLASICETNQFNTVCISERDKSGDDIGSNLRKILK